MNQLICSIYRVSPPLCSRLLLLLSSAKSRRQTAPPVETLALVLAGLCSLLRLFYVPAPTTQRRAHNRLPFLSRLDRLVGNIMLLTPLTPGDAQTTTLIIVRPARKTHTGRLLAPIICRARGKDAAASALLARMHAAAAATSPNARVVHHVVAVNPARAWLRRVQLRGIQLDALIPADSVGHF
jgi:hypothetical protein